MENLINARLAVLLYSRSQEDHETEYFLRHNQIPLGYTVFDCRLDDTCEFEASTYHIEGDTSSCLVIKAKTRHKSNAALLQKIFSLGYTHIVYSHHDSFCADQYTWGNIHRFCSTYPTGEYGLIGFNILHDNEINSFLKGRIHEGTLARTILQPGNGYYNTSVLSCKPELGHETYDAISVEIPMWSTCLISAESFLRLGYIPSFEFHLEFDDLAFHYLKSNIPNICLPSISFFHQQSTSTLFGRQYKSPMSKVQQDRLHIAHQKWYQKWGFEFGIRKNLKSYWRLLFQELLGTFGLHSKQTISRETYIANKCEEAYAGTLIDKVFRGKIVKYRLLQNEIIPIN